MQDKVEKETEKLEEVCDNIGWVVDSISEHELNSKEILLEAVVRLTIKKQQSE